MRATESAQGDTQDIECISIDSEDELAPCNNKEQSSKTMNEMAKKTNVADVFSNVVMETAKLAAKLPPHPPLDRPEKPRSKDKRKRTTSEGKKKKRKKAKAGKATPMIDIDDESEGEIANHGASKPSAKKSRQKKKIRAKIDIAVDDNEDASKADGRKQKGKKKMTPIMDTSIDEELSAREKALPSECGTRPRPEAKCWVVYGSTGNRIMVHLQQKYFWLPKAGPPPRHFSWGKNGGVEKAWEKAKQAANF